MLPFADCSQLSSNTSGDITFNTSSASEITTPPRTTTLACTMLNARSIVNKRHYLHALLTSEHLDIVAITETFLGDVNDAELIDCSSYRIFRRDRDRHGGGVMIIIRNSLPALRRTDLETECEVLWVEIMRRNRPLLFGVYYRPPQPLCQTYPSQILPHQITYVASHHLMCGLQRPRH